MKKPKTVQILIYLWIITIVLLILHFWYYYVNCLIGNYSNFESYVAIWVSLFFSIISIIVSILIIYRINNVNKWSWLLNAMFSFYFFFHYGIYLVYSIGILVFSNNATKQYYFSYPSFMGWTLGNFVIPILMTIIFVLLFRPGVKEYFNQT